MERENHKTINVRVNNEPVAFSVDDVTGLKVKEIAIDQGVKIKLDFNLFIIHEGREPEQVGDEQKIEIHEGERFRAVTPDDKS